jgi:preprotein translocase subunit YajC
LSDKLFSGIVIEIRKGFINMNSILLAQESMLNSQGGGLVQTMIMIGIAIVSFYFILYRPQQKQRAQADALRESLKKGDKVTAMAIVGTVDKINKDTVVLKMIDGSKIEMLKAAITDVQSSTDITIET